MCSAGSSGRSAAIEVAPCLPSLPGVFPFDTMPTGGATSSTENAKTDGRNRRPKTKRHETKTDSKKTSIKQAKYTHKQKTMYCNTEDEKKGKRHKNTNKNDIPYQVRLEYHCRFIVYKGGGTSSTEAQKLFVEKIS